MLDGVPHTSAAAPTAPQELAAGEQLLVGATRFWAQVWRTPGEDSGGLARLLRFYGAEAALGPCETFLFASFAMAHRPLAIRQLDCGRLSSDEERIVHAVGCAQAGHGVRAERLLAGWLPPLAVGMSAPVMQDLANVLAAEKITVPVRPWRTCRRPHSVASPPAAAASTSLLIH